MYVRIRQNWCCCCCCCYRHRSCIVVVCRLRLTVGNIYIIHIDTFGYGTHSCSSNEALVFGRILNRWVGSTTDISMYVCAHIYIYLAIYRNNFPLPLRLYLYISVFGFDIYIRICIYL